jgi:hypothetical protein
MSDDETFAGEPIDPHGLIDQVRRLRAERDAARAERDEQKRRADYLSKDFDRDIKMYQAEVAELRTNLAAANARAEYAEQRLRVQEKWIGRAEAAEARERVKDELLKDTRPFCHGCFYVKDGRLADRYAAMLASSAGENHG